MPKLRPSKFSSTAAETGKRKVARYTLTWTNPMSNGAIRIRITHTRSYFGTSQDYIEIETTAPKRARLPMTESGYRSHFIDALDLAQAGGPVTFVSAWLEREAKSREWIARENRRAQGDLFAWAESKQDATLRRKPRTRAPTPRRVADPEISQDQAAIRRRVKARDRRRKPKPPREP